MRSVLRPMVKYGPAGGRGHPVHKTETQATTLMARRLGPSGLRSKMALSSSTCTSTTSTTSSAVPRALNKYAGYNFLTWIQIPETVDLMILVSFVNHLAFRGAHMRICDAKEGGLYKCSLKSKLIELTY